MLLWLTLNIFLPQDKFSHLLVFVQSQEEKQEIIVLNVLNVNTKNTRSACCSGFFLVALERIHRINVAFLL